MIALLARRSLSLSAASLGLALVACGPQSVTPSSDAGSDRAALPDAAPPPSCDAPITLFEGDQESLYELRFARTSDGYVALNYTARLAVSAQAFDRGWSRLGPALAIAYETATDIAARNLPSVQFVGRRGVITFGASMHELEFDPASGLALRASSVARLSGLPDAERHSLLGAWPRVISGGRDNISAITTDGSVWIAEFGRFSRRFVSAQNALLAGTDVHFVAVDSDEYLAFNTVLRRGSNNDVRVRRFSAANGTVTAASDRMEVGTMIAPPVRVGSSLWRLHQQHGDASSGVAREFSLIEHDPRTGATQRRLPIADRALVLNGAIGTNDAQTDVAQSFVVWAREDLDAEVRNSIVAQWGADGARTTLVETLLSPEVYAAWVEPGDARAWVVYGVTNQQAPYDRQVFARCVAR